MPEDQVRVITLNVNRASFDSYLFHIISLEKLIWADAVDKDHEVLNSYELYPFIVEGNKKIRQLNISNYKVNKQIGVSTLAFRKKVINLMESEY